MCSLGFKFHVGCKILSADLLPADGAFPQVQTDLSAQVTVHLPEDFPANPSSMATGETTVRGLSVSVGCCSA